MELLIIALVGGFVGLDGTSAGQFMISRPLVAATVGGWLMGDPVQGILLGALLELFMLPAFPMGGGRFPEEGPASLAAGAVTASTGGFPGLAVGVMIGLFLADLGGTTVMAIRRLNERLAPDPDDALTARGVTFGHLAAVGADFIRGAVLVLVAVGLGRPAGRVLASAWPLGAEATDGVLIACAAVSAGALLKALGAGAGRLVVFAAGVAGGVLAAGIL